VAEPDWRSKLDPRLREKLARAGDRNDRDVRVIVQFAGPAPVLESLGLSVGTVAGQIATGSIRLQDLRRAASSPRIIYIEGAHARRPDA
jgi:hypothetical protein